MAFKPDHTKQISLVTPEDKFYCRYQLIITSRDQWRKVKLDISRVSTYYDSNILDRHRTAFLTNEGRNKAYNPDPDKDSTPDLDITQCTKKLFNDPLNLNIKPPSSNFSKKDNGTPIIPPKYRKGSQPGRISYKEGNRTDDYNLKTSHKENCSDQQQGQLYKTIPLNCGTIN